MQQVQVGVTLSFLLCQVFGDFVFFWDLSGSDLCFLLTTFDEKRGGRRARMEGINGRKE